MRIKDKAKQLFDGFEAAMYPEFRCDFCGRELEAVDGHLCVECLSRLVFHNANICKFCGANINREEVVCDECRADKFAFDGALSVCDYDEISGGLIKNLKYNGRAFLAAHLAKMMFDYFVSRKCQADVVTFVPQSAERTRERGFNQAELIAKCFSKLSGIKCVPLLLKTGKHSNNQASLNFQERQKNMRGTISLIEGVRADGQRVLLIDDVFTTGATANECAKLIKNLKPKSITVLTFAKTVLKNRTPKVLI